MEKKKFYNRTYIVNRDLQLMIILHTVTLAAWVSLIHFFFRPTGNDLYVWKYRLSEGLLSLIVLFIGISTSLIWALLLTNKIAGPIFRLRNHMEEVAEGKTTEEIGFRKLDYFSELLIPYNKVIARLRAETEKNKK